MKILIQDKQVSDFALAQCEYNILKDAIGILDSIQIMAHSKKLPMTKEFTDILGQVSECGWMLEEISSWAEQIPDDIMLTDEHP